MIIWAYGCMDCQIIHQELQTMPRILFSAPTVAVLAVLDLDLPDLELLLEPELGHGPGDRGAPAVGLAEHQQAVKQEHMALRQLPAAAHLTQHALCGTGVKRWTTVRGEGGELDNCNQTGEL